jgi:hypothetical protein
MGVQIDNDINNGRGPYVFRIQGKLYHKIGTFSPLEGCPPKYQWCLMKKTQTWMNKMNLLPRKKLLKRSGLVHRIFFVTIYQFSCDMQFAVP